jgi:hypothetical protein
MRGWNEAYSGRRKSYPLCLLILIGHMVGTALIFTVLFSLGWLVSFLLHKLNAIYPFPAQILSVVTSLEIVLIYLDTALSGIVLLAGMVRFINDIRG